MTGLSRALLGAALSLVAAEAHAQSIDPSRLHRARAAPGAEARGARGDGARTGRAADALPSAPQVKWRKSLAGPLEVAPVASRDGRVALIVAGSSEVLLVGAGGEDLGAVSIGAQVAAASPAFLADGTLVVVSSDGNVVFAGVDRRVRHRFALGQRGGEVLALTPTPSGGVVVVAGRLVVELSADARVLARVQLDETPTAPVAVARAPSGGHDVLFGMRGELHAFHAPFGPRRITSLGGPATGGVATADDGAAWLVVGGALLRIERRAGAVPWKANATAAVAASFHAPALGHDGTVAFVGTDGSLVLLEPSGEVRHRVALERAAGGAPAPGLPRSLPVEEGPPIFIDGDGRVAFARASGRVGVVMPDGRMALASERVCVGPNGLAPTGPGSFVVGCAEGTLVGIAEAASTEPPAD